MKGIILAGGSGTRLHPLTIGVSKQLLPIYDKPMIYYPLSTLMLAGIREILIISTEKDLDSFKNLLGDGKNLGCNFSYKVQKKPNGLAEAFILGEKFIGNSKVALILGDNIFYGKGLGNILREQNNNIGATVFAYHVNNPEDYGVVQFDKNKKVISIEEKPINPKSNYIIPGLYFYDNNVVNYAKMISPSERGELEITSLNNIYLEKSQLNVEVLDRGLTWFDTGTFESLNCASDFIRIMQDRSGDKIACIEEVAYLSKFINKDQLEVSINKYKKSQYGDYLKKIKNKNNG
jgi:glucose-1-phosphate thymidylyltransferase